MFDEKQLFIKFINQLEGWKARCKNLHWSAPDNNIHKYLDDFFKILVEYQDELVEDYMGINGKISPTSIRSIDSDEDNAYTFIHEVRDETLAFYSKLPNDIIYKGIVSECESFIHNINKYNYLFRLCNSKHF